MEPLRPQPTPLPLPGNTTHQLPQSPTAVPSGLAQVPYLHAASAQLPQGRTIGTAAVA